MEGWEEERRNRNRGYRESVVWQDAITLLRQTSLNLSTNEYHLRRLVSQQLACVDSVHRNMAEGWCRRGLGEYLYFLNVALASLGERVREVAEDYGEFHDPALTLPIPQAPTTPGLLP